MGPMPRARTNGIEVEYETFGDAGAAPLLLISGLGMQLVGWDVEFCSLLVDREFYGIRFDNRDVGLTTWMDGGEGYNLDDMAEDAVGLLDWLRIPAAHIVGASMGGFIAQLMAVNHPERVLSLTSLISGPNGEDQVQPTQEAVALLMTPPRDTREGRIAQGLFSKQTLLGPDDPYEEEWERPRVERAVDRAYHPAGFVRQLQAIGAAPSRIPRLGSLRVPALVVHGDADILIPVENGRRVAAAIPGARYIEIPGMGHDIPRRVWVQVADAIAQLALT